MKKAPGSTFWNLVALLTAMATPVARAQTIDPDKVATVKAAYVLNFIKYTQWPDGTFAESDSPIILTVVGDGGYNQILEDLVRRSDPVNGRRIELRRLEYPKADSEGRIDPEAISKFYQSLEASNAVYVTATSRERVRQISEKLRGKDVLTIGDTSRFAENGGMLGLVLQENRVVFQANSGEIQKSKLTVSAKVLKLAQIVETSPS
jgi:hypothetical protein